MLKHWQYLLQVFHKEMVLSTNENKQEFNLCTHNVESRKRNEKFEGYIAGAPSQELLVILHERKSLILLGVAVSNLLFSSESKFRGVGMILCLGGTRIVHVDRVSWLHPCKRSSQLQFQLWVQPFYSQSFIPLSIASMTLAVCGDQTGQAYSGWGCTKNRVEGWSLSIKSNLL